MEKLPLPHNMDPFVKEIIYFENDDTSIDHSLPFYADGFAGIVFSTSKHPFSIQPQDKVLPELYLFGQTIKPMALKVKGAFQIYGVRLFPFAVRTLLGVNPRTLNDDCYDLLHVVGIDTEDFIQRMKTATTKTQVVEILSEYFEVLLKNAARNPDNRVILATNLILKTNGNIKVKEIRERLHISERTLERQFKKEIGVAPTQFAKIIQFHSSVKILSEKDYINLTDVSYKSGYTDQSHFIRSFKKYTGKTPKEFQKQLAL